MKKRNHPLVKSSLHPRNKHRSRYNFRDLMRAVPELGPFVSLNKYKDESIDFANPEAVKLLNKALLKSFYGLDYWDIPEGYLCPPIPGRADYIHYMADLLAETNLGYFPKGEKLSCLDIGVGANCVYPILGVQEYNMNFIGSDIDAKALASAQKIVDENPSLKEKISLRLQKDKKYCFKGIVEADERFDIVVCNPPFHLSPEMANAGTERKVKNLNPGKKGAAALNFGGQNNELWCEGGEFRFVSDMIAESKEFGKNCFWFSSLIAKEAHLKGLYAHLKRVGAKEVKTIPMGQGNKVSRLIVWTFLDRAAQEHWRKNRWG